ncbi:MAG TPA: glycosyltransferase N-terminal domain-containing protein [Stellaceae bacterium]
MKVRGRWGRHLVRSEGLRRLFCWVIQLYIRLVYRTNRWSVEGGDIPLRLRQQGRPFILAFWHGRLLMIPMAWQRLAPMHMLISAHRDGRIIADAVTYFGVNSIAGSTRRGGMTALRAMLKQLAAGDCVGITPDGPRGPAMHASAGIVNAARLARVPIVPVTFATSARWVLSTWDRLHLALPFGRGVFIWGEPIEVEPELDAAGIERTRLLVESRMNAMAEAADRRVGRGLGERRQSVLLPALYRALTGALTPLVRLYLQRRERRGKEDSARVAERLGITRLRRPLGPLVWLHAASVGEAASVLALMQRIVEERPRIGIVATTGTVAAARLLEARLPERVFHQFVPVDLPRPVERFLDHWRPDLAIWVESELWPNLVLETHRRGIPMLLLNARLSERSVTRWRALPGLIRPMLQAFALCLAQDKIQAERLSRLGARSVASVGDLKTAAEPLAADPAALDELRHQIGARPVWLAASTHAGEEEIAAAAHHSIVRSHAGLLTIIAPRHPVRGEAISKMLEASGLRVGRRTAGEPIAPNTDVYLADTLGELGLFFRLSRIAFIGGSLAAKGGHNPFEAARLDCAVLHGPDMANCAAMAEALAAAGASETVRDAETLARAVTRLLDDPQARDARAENARHVAVAGSAALDTVLDRLAPWLDALAPIAAAKMLPAAPRAVAAGHADARA